MLKLAGVTFNVMPANDDGTSRTFREDAERSPSGPVACIGISVSGGSATYCTGAVGLTVTRATDWVVPGGTVCGSKSTVTPGGTPPAGTESATGPVKFARETSSVNRVELPWATRCSVGRANTVRVGNAGGPTGSSQSIGHAVSPKSIAHAALPTVRRRNNRVADQPCADAPVTCGGSFGCLGVAGASFMVTGPAEGVDTESLPRSRAIRTTENAGTADELAHRPPPAPKTPP